MLMLNPPRLAFIADKPTPTLSISPGGVATLDSGLGSGSGGAGSVPAHLAHQVTPVGPATLFGKKKQPPAAAPRSAASSAAVDVLSSPAALRPKTAAGAPSVADESAKASYYWQRQLQEALEEAEAWRRSSEEYQGYLQAMRRDRDAWKARALAPPGAPAPLPAVQGAAPTSSGFPWWLLAIGGGAAGLWLIARRRQAGSPAAPTTKKEAA